VQNEPVFRFGKMCSDPSTISEYLAEIQDLNKKTPVIIGCHYVKVVSNLGIYDSCLRSALTRFKEGASSARAQVWSALELAYAYCSVHKLP